MNQQNEPTFSVEPTGLPNALVVPEAQRLAGMNIGGAFERIAELEAKLKIATENAAQAVKERDLLREEVFKINHAMYARTSSLMKERDELREAVLSLGMLFCYEHNAETMAAWNRLVAKLHAEKGEEGKP